MNIETLSPILVTGASGFVGQHLVHQLAGTEAAVIATGRTRSVILPVTTNDSNSHSSRVEVVTIDLANLQSVTQLITQTRPRAVIHCAAATNVAFCQQEPDAARRDIVEATNCLCQAIREHSPHTPFVALSTDLVFERFVAALPRK